MEVPQNKQKRFHDGQVPVQLVVSQEELEVLSKAAKKERRPRVNFIRHAALDRAEEVLRS